jgi:hypothetical protein
MTLWELFVLFCSDQGVEDDGGGFPRALVEDGWAGGGTLALD